MGILGWIVLGLLAGAIAKAVMPGKDPGGIVMTMVLGVVGALLGGWVGSALFGTGTEDFFSIQTWIVAILGSIVLLAIYRMVVGRRGSPRAHA
ncbi:MULTISPECIES: GlsB/YeaQ/YmgE family stress response membrane protein [Actinoalloteichus]|uniref:Membrane protein n=1 Tax=Actinoalloteichus fjordicus TaxID=1612552 RepID=A0AAC9PRA4_9PSEU|nr:MULTISPECIES: GlsB/YeaQ/YmgE family stress response membrane protein [Actinoalloteichus]APU13865.1 putative membrane protein [Actinoalloteichus fjordicus]APU19811.1 putative membrane protein [Actinoalloteichus sp. GBA129-24]